MNLQRPAASATPAPELQSPVPSPCISLCEMAPAIGAEPALCRGCLRTIDEIVKWGGSDDNYKRAVYAQIRVRESQIAF